ncbi:alanine racemase [Listeria sp. ILCC797]|uniref:alanine racemase n=1 Tax=Listeria sp. ILCC797 TaxID=1918333 RepID=UPI000B59052C|nr:alanine racemase [Listeria sp. ILCC797]
MVTGWHRPTWIEVNLNAIEANIKNEQKQLPKNVEIFAVVKANAYGHGMIPVAEAAKKAGATGFCVAILDEALALRAAGFSDPILVMGAILVEDAALASENDISITVFHQAFFDELDLNEGSRPLKIHLKVDTGMGRLGFRTKPEIKTALKSLNENAQLHFEGIYTHFATADEIDTTYFNTQWDKFQDMLTALPEKPRYVHAANSATSLLHAKAQNQFNAIRFGIGMYGLPPSTEIEAKLPFKLQPALSLFSKIVQVKELHPSDHVSYGATYEANKNEWVGTVPIGYADGIIRHYSGFHVLVAGKPCEIIGRVCMDQLIIRLPNYVDVGTRVTIIGKDGATSISATDVAEYLDTINYEVTCLLSDRLPRIYPS